MNTITLPSGYNGHTVECYIKPLEVDGNMVKLRVVRSEHLIRWISIKEWKETLKLLDTKGQFAN